MRSSPSDSQGAPIFVCGTPRSGVRLLAALLDGAPHLASGPELPFVLTMAQQWRDIEATLGRNHERHYGLTPSQVRAAFSSAILQLVTERLAATGKARFVFQSFGITLLLNTFAALFPMAKFLLCVRDPRDAVCSLLRCDWRDPRSGARLPYTLDAGVAARFLNDFMQLALPAVSELLAANRLSMIRYEALCTQPVEQLHVLAQFVRQAAPPHVVGKDSAALAVASHNNEHPPLRAGALRSDRVGCWRELLPLAQRHRVEQLTAGLRRHFGYG
jgi:Sulfotransferase family